MGKFDGKVVVVTGSARGLGRDYARYFAADGANVMLADVKEMESAAAEATAARVGTSRDLYDAMAYLCGTEASWVAGQTLRVDGGALAR